MTARRYTADFNEVKRLGGDGITTPSARTAEQTEIALFWVESSPLQWNRIARTVSAEGLDLWENARLFGLLNMALADGYIGSFDTKYHGYNYWRPVTAIRRIPTAIRTPAPTRPGRPWCRRRPSRLRLGTLCRRGRSIAEVLRRFFGTDHRLHHLQPDAAGRGTCDDAASPPYIPQLLRRPGRRASRAFSLGSHFRKAVDEGIDHGRRIGNRAVNHFLRPVH